jgi:hypothetical protein
MVILEFSGSSLGGFLGAKLLVSFAHNLISYPFSALLIA